MRTLSIQRRQFSFLCQQVGISLALFGSVASAQTLPPPPVSPTPVVKYEYDAEGLPTKTVVAPTTRAYATTHEYDSLGRPKKSTDAKSGLIDYGYDLQDQLTSITDPRRLQTQYKPTGLGDVEQLISPDTGTANSKLDAAGNLKTRTDARGVLATYDYDELDRTKQVVYSRAGFASRTISWTYDQTGANFGAGVGRLTTATTPDATTTFRYDTLGRVTTATQSTSVGSALVVGFVYDGAGNVTSLTYPSGRAVTYTRVNGQPLSIKVTSGTTTKTVLDQIAINPLGSVKSWIWRFGASPITHEFIYDIDGRMVRHTLGGVVRDITYDDADRISRFTHLNIATATPSVGLDQVFGYDELNRLTSATGATNWSYTYDANGNRLTSQVGATSRSYTVQATSNRVDGLSNPTRSFGFDNTVGNTLSDIQAGSSSNFTATYSLEGRWATMAQGSSVGVDFGYDAMGRRVTRGQWVNSPSNPRTYTLYAYDSSNHLIGEYSSTGVPITEYVWLGDIPVAVVKSDASAPGGFAIYALHTDHLNTPRLAKDAQNQTRWRWLGEPFGSSPAEEQPTPGYAPLQVNLRFPGQQYEPLGGRHYNHFRDYDPTIGRYVQSDPIGLGGGINTYAYVNGNPVGDVDPTGEFGVVGGLVGGLGDLGYQLYKNGGNLKCVNWWEVGSWALTGSGAGIVGRAGLTGIANFFSNANKFRNISRAYWGTRGGANGMSLDHWMISQAAGRSGAVSESIVNGGWNLLEMPRTWNTWLGFAPSWGGTDAALAAAARLGIQLGVPGVAAASGYAGYQIGTNAQQEQCGCK